jgi:hypothetical protein
MNIPEVADLIGGTGGVCDEFDPPLKLKQMGLDGIDMHAVVSREMLKHAGRLEQKIRGVMSEQSLTFEQFNEQYCVQFAPGDIVGEVVRKPLGPFDTENLADVEPLPVCCICGKTITGIAEEHITMNGKVDYWYCKPCVDGADGTFRKTGQGELGI